MIRMAGKRESGKSMQAVWLNDDDDDDDDDDKILNNYILS